MKAVLAVTAVLVATSGAPAMADWIGPLPITAVDTLAPGIKYVTLQGYANALCDENRILLDISDAEYRKEVFATVLSAFHAGARVSISMSASAGQCRGNRVVVSR